MAIEGAQNNQSKSAQISLFKDPKSDKQNEINQLSSQLSAEQDKLNSKISVMSAELDKKIAAIEDMAAATKGAGFFTDKGKLEKPFKDRKPKKPTINQINNCLRMVLTSSKQNDKRIDALTKDIADIDAKLSQLASNASSAPIIDPKVIEDLERRRVTSNH